MAMMNGTSRSALRQIRALYTLGTLGGATDAQLLDLFLTRDGDEAEDAFAALVHRHAPMVLGACRRMLRDPDDAEDAFQATFFILARKAASIGRRDRLASWLHGVALRTASEARRRAARQRARERRLMEVSRVESVPAEEWDDHLLMLDEELNRLPQRYRAALVACELEGKSRSQAARELGLREGTLSTHLARGRKLLRERLLRRGVDLGMGPVAGLSRRVVEAAITDRLIDSTVRGSLHLAAGTGAAGTVPEAVATLAERVIKRMFLGRLALLLAPALATGMVAAVVLGLIATAAEPQHPDPAGPGAEDLSGRVVDLAGAGVADAQVWAVGSRPGDAETIAAARTDAQGRFILTGAWEREAAKAAMARGGLGLLARCPDGRLGWLATIAREDEAGKANRFEIAVGPVGAVRGRVIDQAGRPVAGARVAPVRISRPGDWGSGEAFDLNPEAAAPCRTVTAADGSFALEGTPQGTRVLAAVDAEGFGSLRFSWDSTRPVTFAIDSRVGRIEGRIKPPAGRGLPRPIAVRAQLSGAPAHSAPRPYQMLFFRSAPAGADGSFRLDDLPPGRYLVDLDFDRNAPLSAGTVEPIEVGPGAVASVDIPLERLATLNGRVVDIETGRGIAGIPIRCYRARPGGYLIDEHRAETDADGRYTIATAPGVVKILPEGVPRAYLIPRYSQSPDLEVEGDRAWPDLKIARAATLDGLVVDENGRPVAGADVLILQRDRGGPEPPHDRIRSGPDGTFHLDRLDPDGAVTLWARTMLATTDGGLEVRPGEVRGRLTLTIDPRFACEIRGMATEETGRRVSGAKVKLWWGRPYARDSGQDGSQFDTVLDTYATTANGWFVFRGLWPNFPYGIEVAAKGHAKVESHMVTGKSGETHDVGRLVLLGIGGRLAGRVVDADGRPMGGVAVFNQGDGPRAVATSTDARGRFQLGWLYPGAKFAFARQDGYHFAGARADDDAEGLVITMHRPGEPSTAWKPSGAPTFDDQRAFARRVVVRLREKLGPDPANNGGYEWALAMGPIDPALALEWSAELGHRYDSRIRQFAAQQLAEADAPAALALMSKDRDDYTLSFFLRLAERYDGSDPAKARLFAEEASARVRMLGPNRRPGALATAGALLARSGRPEVGRALIDRAAVLAERSANDARMAQGCAIVAGVLAPTDLKRALAIVDSIEAEDKDRFIAIIARAIAATDTDRAISLADGMSGPANRGEWTRTAIAFGIGADRPDDAIAIIEGMTGDHAVSWRAEAFGWLAVALAPRDRGRAFALIDRALAMTIDGADPGVGSGFDGLEMLAAAHIAARARQIGYPDMESVIMRVLAARSGRWQVDRLAQSRKAMHATISLALVDPGAARTALEQIETRGGLDPVGFPIARRPRLLAWVLVDLEKAEAVFEAEMATFHKDGKPHPVIQGMLFAVEALAAPPARREAAIKGGFYGGSWRPGN